MLISMILTAPESIAALAAVAVFLSVLFRFRTVRGRDERERETARRQWEADLRTRGA
jgi:hypothetical protein